MPNAAGSGAVMRTTAQAQAGFTLVEMLLTIAILGIVMTIVSTFLNSTWTLADQTRASNEMQMNLRSAMEMISTDLFSAGSRGVQFTCDQASVIPALASARPAARRHTLTVRYCDPYTVNTPVVVTYNVQADAASGNLLTLYRNGTPAIPGIVGLELEFSCAPTPCTSDPTVSTFNPTLVRSVTIRMAAQSTRRARGVTSTYTFNGTPLAAEPGFYYEYVRQDVSPRSLGN